jgi:DNA invertase Pin-like site-specific DNA recombinase
MRTTERIGNGDGQRVAWAYCRVSTTKDEQELSLEEQIAWATSYAQSNNLRLRVFSEKASAKTIVQRPIIVSMLQAIRDADPAQKPALIIATSFDRLARDVFDSFTLFGTLRDAAVEVFVRDGGPMKMQSPVDAAILFGRAFGGHAENQARSDRMKASWERRRRQGKPTSNKMPYGIQLLDERDTPAPETSAWVLRAFEWYAQGDGMLTIARRLESAPSHRVLTSKIGPDGQRLARERHTLWEANRVRKLLEQRRYRGLIVSEDLFDKVQEIIASKPRWSNVRKSEYPLSGSMQCAKCGRNPHGHATGGSTRRLANGEVRRYRSAVRYYSCYVCRYMLNAERAEAQFLAKLATLSASDALLNAWIESEVQTSVAELKSELDNLQKKLDPKRLDKARARVWELAMANKSLPSGELDRQLARMAKEEQTTKTRVAEILELISLTSNRARTIDNARYLLKNFRRLFEAATYEEKRELCFAIAEALGGITTSPDGIQWIRETRLKPPPKRRPASNIQRRDAGTYRIDSQQS